MMRFPDPRNVRDALLEAGHPPDEVEAMLAAAEARREFVRLKHCFDNAQGLRFEDFAGRAQSNALVALRLIHDIAPWPDWPTAANSTSQGTHLLDGWRQHALSYNFKT